MHWKWILCLSVLLPCGAIGQEAQKAAHVVRASAEATITVKPDRAEISVSVVTHSATAQRAASENAEHTKRVLDSLKQTVGGSGEVKTTGYGVGPDYQNGKNGKPSGYQAANRVLVTVNDLALVGKVVDLATESGANRIDGIQFVLRNDERVRAQAVAEAATKARATADAIAKALNLEVVGVLSAAEEGTQAPMYFGAAMQKIAVQGAETPIEIGTIDIRASVTVTLEVR